ncbi:MAG: hypothetical protein FK733_07470 [Asgard group archaeon]|nr:hypothetical protein [Asgard group archaeon]
MLTNKKKIIRLLKNPQLKRVAILGHTSIDPDSIASTYGMAFLLQKLNSKVEIDILVDGVGIHSNDLLKYYDQPYLTKPNPPYDLIIVVDVNVKSQFGVFEEMVTAQSKNEVIIIDHHTPSDFSKEIKYSFINENKSSTAEIVVDLLFDSKIKITKKLLTILLSGIIYDSRRFFSLELSLLKIIEKMIIHGVDYDVAVNLIQKNIDYSERIARLKSASRMKCYKIKEWLVVWSRVGSHEGSSARAILDVGADVALIYSKRKKQTRLSVRATRRFFAQTNINFAKDVMISLGNQFNGDGGGHSTAAALTIPSVISEEQLKTQAFKILEEKLDDRVKEL